MSTQMNNPINITITLGTVIKTVLVLVSFYVLYLLSDLVLALITAVIIASAIEPFTQWFVKRRIPRVLAVIFIYFSFILFFSLILYFFLPTLLGDFKVLINQIPEYVTTISDKSPLIQDIPALNSFVNDVLALFDTDNFLEKFGDGVAGATVGFFSIASSFFGGILSFILIIVISFYLAVQEDGVSNFLKVVTPIQHESYVLDLWKRARRKIGLWMQGQLLLGVLVGILTYLGLTILGVPNALFLALIAASFELIPLFGPILASIPAIAMAMGHGGLTLTLLVVGLYLIIQQFESQLIHPLVVKKIVGIPALVAILALIVGATIAGFLGIVISVPIAAALMEYLNDLEKKKIKELKLQNEK